MDPELIADYNCHVGEGPLWDAAQRCLYWVDILTGRLFRYSPETGEHELFYQRDGMIGGVTLQADGSLLLLMEGGAIAVLRDGELSYVVEELPGEEELRFNDVIADPAGRVFGGTMPQDSSRAVAGERLGKLYRLDTDGTVTTVLEGTCIPNGMGFTPDRKHMYYTESMDYTIYLYDYDQATGEISNRKAFVETPRDEGLPDGMTVDAEGYVWSARCGGSALVRYTPDGVEDRRVRLPAKMITSAIFGGRDLDEIYVTSLGGNDEAANGPGAGALFRLKLGIKGVVEFHSRIGL